MPRRGRPTIPGIKLIGIRLRTADIRIAKREGRRLKIPYQVLIRTWVAEKAEKVAVI